MIKEITPSEAECIIYSRRPLGVFYMKYGVIYVGIDNRDGNAWTEEFMNLRQCKRWLLNPSVQVPTLERSA